ncbi:Transient receptor potential cation channel subfamily A member 1, partial [Fasciolopsis buskii]
MILIGMSSCFVDVNAKTLHGLTPLHFAAKHGKEDVAESEKCVTDKEFVSALPTEVDDPMIAYLVQHGAKVNERDQNGLTPLHYAAARGRVMAAKQLLREGAIVECTDYEEMTPLLMAVKNQHRSLVELLLDSDADYMRMDKWHNNVTPLIFAAKLGKVDICDELLNNGADCFQQDSYHNNALFCAIMNKHHAVVERLISTDRGAELLQTKDDSENSPLHVAVRTGSLKTTDLLLNSDTSIWSVNSSEHTPLHVAAIHGRYGLVSAFDQLSPSEIIYSAFQSFVYLFWLTSPGAHVGVDFELR